LVARAVQLDYAALAITDECSLAGVVRAHAEAKGKIPLIIGSYFRLTHPDGSPGPALLALARNREDMAIFAKSSLARNRVAKGSYLLTPADLAAPPPAFAHLKGLPDCSLILLPNYPAHRPQDVDQLHAQAAWMEATFPGRAWMGLNLLLRSFDEAHRLSIAEVAAQHQMAVVAVGHVCMHALAQAAAGYDDGDPHRQAGGRVRLRAGAERRAAFAAARATGQSVSAGGAGRNAAHRRACTFNLEQLRYEYPHELIPPATRRPVICGRRWRRAAGALARWRAREGAHPDRAELVLIADLKYEPIS
jgi:error-prone DNA polymerase